MALAIRYFLTVSKLSLNLRNGSGSAKIAFRDFATRADLIEEYDLLPRFNTGKNYKYILDSEVAANVANKLHVQGKLVVEASPGPGVLTRELIRNGARKVIGLEPTKKFLPSLVALQNDVGSDVFQVRYADFAKIDPNVLPNGQNTGRPIICRPPGILSKDVFSEFEAVDWQSDEIPVTFVGIEGGKSSAKTLLNHLSRLPNRESIFQMGRTQLSFFYAQDRLEKLLAKPGSRQYNRMSILIGIFCDISVIHKEPCSSFNPYSSKESKKSLTLLRITPKKRVDVNVPEYCRPFISFFIRLLMLRPSQPLVMALQGIIPGSSEILEHLELPSDIRALDLTPHQFAMVANEFFQKGDRSQLDFFYSMYNTM